MEPAKKLPSSRVLEAIPRFSPLIKGIATLHFVPLAMTMG